MPGGTKLQEGSDRRKHLGPLSKPECSGELNQLRTLPGEPVACQGWPEQPVGQWEILFRSHELHQCRGATIILTISSFIIDKSFQSLLKKKIMFLVTAS